MRTVLALVALTVLVQPTPLAVASAATTLAQANDCTGPNCPPKRDCEKEKTIS